MLSIYEKIFPIKGSENEEFMLFNGLYGAFDKISSHEADIFYSGKFDGLDPERKKYFVKRGHITEDLEHEQENLRLISKLHSLTRGKTNIGIIIAPTYNCNLRCEYCFEKHRLKNGEEWLKRVMSPEIIDAIFEQIKKYKDKGYIIQDVSLYGGEPLLACNKELIREFFRRSEELNLKVGAVTNGCELDKFLEFNFSMLQITVDGLRETHDRRRFFADGSGSYDKIIKNIALALEKGIKIGLRINISHSNFNAVRELPKEFERLGFLKYKHFSYYFTSVHEENPVSDVAIAEELKNMGKSLRDIIKLEGAYSTVAFRISDFLKANELPVLNPTHCGAENNMNVIGAEGLIYPCWSLLAKEESAIGFVDEEGKRFLYDLNASQWHNRTADRLKPCNTCPLIMICGGGCAGYDSKYLKEGNCDEAEKIFDDIAPHISGKSELKSLSMREALENLSPDERNTLLNTDDINKALGIYKKMKLKMTEK